MTGNLALDWATLAISLFNTVLCLWLGLTVLLNADRQSWGIWLAGGGLLLGGAFFLSHTAILGLGVDIFGLFGPQLELWWELGWFPVLFLPLSWYSVILWYAGFFEDRQSGLYRRHRGWLVITMILLGGLLSQLLFARTLPSPFEALHFDINAVFSIGGIPVFILIYLMYMLLCVVLALDALRRPGPSRRWMGELARKRARPWLVATSLVLLLVGLLVGGVMIWVVFNAWRGPIAIQTLLVLAGFDLGIASLIGVALLVLGQAVVSYEIFTGRTLPRRGLQRQWQRAVIFAGGYGVIISGAWSFPIPGVYSLLLSTVLLTAFFALLSWRSFADRDRYIRNLRPFLSSHRLYEDLVSSTKTGTMTEDFSPPFIALCEGVLDTSRAYLLALGPLAPLIGPPLSYPPGEVPDLPGLGGFLSQVGSSEREFVQVAAVDFGGASWAIPLWSERGLIGVLLLGEKQDGGVYTREEIEIAQTTGERLIDTHASAVMARRLMALQRQRFTENQVLNQQPRRILHDEILPQIHAAMLSLKAETDPTGVDSREPMEALTILADVHREIAGLLKSFPAAVAPEVREVGLIIALQVALKGELADPFDNVGLQISPEATQKALEIPPTNAEVLYYAAREVVRNAARHGRGDDQRQPLNLKVDISWASGLRIVVEDDGVGMNPGEMWETTGQGLVLHSTMMAVVGGTLSVDSVPGKFTRVTIHLPSDRLGAG